VSLNLQTGEYRLYSDKKLPDFGDLATVYLSQITGQDVSVFPNPVKNTFHISSTQPIQQVYIYSIEGKLLRQYFPKSNQIEIDINSFKTGIYMINTYTGNQHFIKKIVKN